MTAPLDGDEGIAALEKSERALVIALLLIGFAVPLGVTAIIHIFK